MRKTKQATINELETQVAMLRGALSQAQARVEKLEHKVTYTATIERRFDQLLEGMCMGMREGKLPRSIS